MTEVTSTEGLQEKEQASSKTAWLVAGGAAAAILIAAATGSIQGLGDTKPEAEKTEEAPPEMLTKPQPIGDEADRQRRLHASTPGPQTGGNPAGQTQAQRPPTPEELKASFEAAMLAERRKKAIEAISAVESNRTKPWSAPAKSAQAVKASLPSEARQGKPALYPGQNVPCELETDLVSDYVGGYTCTVRGDQRDITGRSIVVPDGSVVFGYYNRQSGQNQILNSAVQGTVLYITRPDGSFLKPDQKGLTDQSGVPAVTGSRDYHVLAQAGALGVGALFTLASAMVPNSGGLLSPQQDTLRNTAQAARQQANQVLQKFMSIEPTDTVTAGTLVNFMVQKPLYDDPVAN